MLRVGQKWASTHCNPLLFGGAANGDWKRIDGAKRFGATGLGASGGKSASERVSPRGPLMTSENL